MEQEIRERLDQKRYREAFELILPEYQDKVFRLAYAMLGDAAMAEDTAQEVFIRIWKALAGYRGQSSVSTWIYAITRNACLTALKRTAGKREISMEEPGVGAAVERLGGPATGVQAQIDVSALVTELPEKHRQVLRLYYMEERSYEEVSKLLAMPMGTVKAYLHRGRKQLAEALARSKMEKRPS